MNVKMYVRCRMGQDTRKSERKVLTANEAVREMGSQQWEGNPWVPGLDRIEVAVPWVKPVAG